MSKKKNRSKKARKVPTEEKPKEQEESSTSNPQQEAADDTVSPALDAVKMQDDNQDDAEKDEPDENETNDETDDDDDDEQSLDDDNDEQSLDDDDEEQSLDDGNDDPTRRRVLSLKSTVDFNKQLQKRGIVYMARIPPRMTPTKVKALLSDFDCEVTRVYLAPQDRKHSNKRRPGGPKRYKEGWIEFASKRVAKHVAASLNNTAMTNYKRSHHYGDLWMLKYLSKFKWSHLTEKVAYERRVQEQKLRLETMQARKETVAYQQLVESGHKLDKIQERKRKRGERMTMKQKNKKPHKDGPFVQYQVQPVAEGDSKAGKSALLGSLI